MNKFIPKFEILEKHTGEPRIWLEGKFKLSDRLILTGVALGYGFRFNVPMPWNKEK